MDLAMRRSILVAALVAVATTACTGAASPPREPSAVPSSAVPAEPTHQTPRGRVSQRLAYYAPLIRGLARHVTFGEPADLIVVRTEICVTAADPPFFGGEGEVCRDEFSADERSALRRRLDWFSDRLWFVEDDVLKAVGQGRGIAIWVGPPKRTDRGIRIGGGIWCGGLCAEGGTYVLERRDDRWVFGGYAATGMSWIT